MSYKWDVDGFYARSEEEYKAALRDKAKIDKIKAKMDLNNKRSVENLYSSILNGQIKFETSLGFQFEDDIDELFNSKVNNKSSKSKTKSKEKVAVKKTEKSKEAPKQEKKIEASNQTKLTDYDEEMQKEIMHQIKIRDSRRKLFLIITSVVAFFCLAYFGIYSFFTNRTQRQIDELASLKTSEKASYTPTGTVHNGLAHLDNIELPDVLDEYKVLYSKNQSIIGWINIADTNIDYPVMQCGDNEYYLTHNFSQDYDKNGSIFMDCNCSAYPKSTNLIIYGHHMSSGKMFGTLQKFENYDYYLKHSVIAFDTIYEHGQYAIMYVFRDKIHSQDDIGFKYYEFVDCNSSEEFDSYMNQMKELSFYDTGINASFGDSLITLSTCDYNEKNGRFVIVAKQIE